MSYSSFLERGCRREPGGSGLNEWQRVECRLTREGEHVGKGYETPEGVTDEVVSSALLEDAREGDGRLPSKSDVDEQAQAQASGNWGWRPLMGAGHMVVTRGACGTKAHSCFLPRFSTN